jgi:hypothetical protein
MMKFALLTATAILSAVAVTPATAEAVITNPGFCAQLYPNANCQNTGPNNPYTGDYQRRVQMQNTMILGASPCAMGADFFVSRSGRRIYCH